MLENIVLIALVVSVVLYWWDNQKSAEMALYYIRNECNKSGVQLLDASVARQRTWLRKHPGGGLQICRLFSFEYSDDNEGRKYGHIVLIGHQIVETSFPDRDSMQN